MVDGPQSYEINMTASLGEDGAISLTGDWDSAAAKAEPYQALIDSVLEADPEGVIVLDVSGLEFIDSSGLRSLIGLQRKYGNERDKPLRLRNPGISTKRLLEITGTTDMFEFIETKPEH